MNAMEAYKHWVRCNQQMVAVMENFANTLTWFLPERFTSSEVGPEAVAAILGLTTVLNQHIIDTAPQNFGQGFYQYGKASETAQERCCRSLPSLLAAVKQIEIFVEVTAEHYKGRDNKWSILAAMEAMKACLRFLILHQNGYHMLLSGGEAVLAVESEGRAFTQKALSGRPSSISSISKSHLSESFETKASIALVKFGQRAGVTQKPSWTHHLYPKPSQSARWPADMDSTGQMDSGSIPMSISDKTWESPDTLLVFGEWICILRPLVYVLLIRRYGLKSWKPWVASLGLDAVSLTTILVAAFLKDRKQHGVMGNAQPSFSSEEIREVKRRQLLLVFYLIRDPFFSKYSKRYLVGAQRVLRPVPLIGSLGGKIIDLCSGIQGRYCYTSGS